MGDFLHGMAIKLACASLPVRKVYADVLDNEWPISWTSRSVKNNKTYLNGTMTFRRVSDAVGYDYANAAAAVTMVGDGFTETFTTKNIGVTETSLGKLVYIRCTLSGTIFILALLVIETPGFEGAVEFTETGTYYAFLNSSYVNVEISNADVQFELTAPRLVGYMYNDVGPLPELPGWDKTVYPYAVIMYMSSRDAYMFSFSTEPFVYGSHFIILTTPALNNSNHTDYNMVKSNGETDWKFLRENSDIQLVLNDYELLWCSVDIMDSSGNVKLTASEPVPVYE